MPSPPPSKRCGAFCVVRAVHAIAFHCPRQALRPAPSTGSADALLLARHALARRAAGQVLCIVAAEPADVQRLADELPFFAPALRVAQFPDWETLPYDSFSPHQDLISERLATLWRMRSGDLDVVLVSATTALTRLAPPTFMAGYTFQLRAKMRLNEAALKAQLTLASYSHVSQVVSPGEYAVRGGLIDLFPMGSPVPYRVDLFGDEVDSIRTFDPDTQRSLYPVPEVRLLPGREFPMDEAARNAFRSRWRERIEGDPSRSRIYKDIGAGLATAGIEYYLPLFFEHTATLFDYLGGGSAGPPKRPRSPRGTARAKPGLGGPIPPPWCCTARSTTRCSAIGSTRANAIVSCSTTRSDRSCRRRTCSCAPRISTRWPTRARRWCCAARAKWTGRARCPT